jgi:acyl carrier protein
MTVIDRDAVHDRLRAWLIGANPATAGMAIQHDTNIIESRILESLQVVELILFIEAESGRTVLTEDLDPNKLRTLDAIYEAFFRSGHE